MIWGGGEGKGVPKVVNEFVMYLLYFCCKYIGASSKIDTQARPIRFLSLTAFFLIFLQKRTSFFT